MTLTGAVLTEEYRQHVLKTQLCPASPTPLLQESSDLLRTEHLRQNKKVEFCTQMPPTCGIWVKKRHEGLSQEGTSVMQLF